MSSDPVGRVLSRGLINFKGLFSDKTKSFLKPNISTSVWSPILVIMYLEKY